ncbi:hypothetical protein N7462_008281 [Penicillium macrosclerotiorum]|uniref:uncharacterized protein n=1 Tax=Penicillium macrosclerotiorum TaxID=303699 RepID=UPI002549798F|nr:uncharacterized protein N7462_008281 [Penicillium macrosclerotiorum]KAJ5675384.1 hypothetical protein N7462_008281 [Penicillium macrosclerotiorum]
MDGGPEMRSETKAFLLERGISYVNISAYHPESNGPVERSMRTLKDALSKMTDGITVNATTGISPFYFLFGNEAILPIEHDIQSWDVLPWDTVSTREDLIATRARQLLLKQSEIQEGLQRLERLRESNKEAYDERHVLRNTPLEMNELVLLHNSITQNDLRADTRLRYRWSGPYRIAAVKGNGAYALKELDRTLIYHAFSQPSDGIRRPDAVNGNRLKRFWPRSDLLLLNDERPVIASIE